ncbi:hypothetical protein ANTHONY_137 [Bacillus phage Anthony]|uniref:Uncharacterized protein n=1 Tax=Bacillus phage Anthony TaxID=2024253 RepID=A0A223LFW5_9CAUD|nr:hypothetical protein ANTHONY_137 [Bacillus phage Anthony]
MGKTLTNSQLTKAVDTLQEEIAIMQGSLSLEDMKTYIEYLQVGYPQSEEHAAEIQRISNESATISDATLLSRFSLTQILEEFDNKLTEVMKTVQIQGKVLKKLGATEEMIDEAAVEHAQQVAEMFKLVDAKAEEQKPEEN